jgi:predicted RNA-binding protein (virulence factor B family)
MSAAPVTTPAAFRELLGKFATLEIRRFGQPGAFLTDKGAAPDAPAILLLGNEIPVGAREGDPVEVFLFLDSEGRPLATTAHPKLALGEVAFLTVTSCTEFGAFVDWGLPKELLIPFAEHTKDVRPGDRCAVGLYLDNTHRLAGTMRVREMLQTGGDFWRGEWVQGEAWREDPDIGLFVILERRFVALLPKHEPHSLRPGDAAQFRVTHIHPDGKVELSSRGHAHEELERDAATILEVLARPGTPVVGDGSDPALIRSLFGLSKKAFKRAVGTLFKTGRIDIDEHGRVYLIDETQGSGGRE